MNVATARVFDLLEVSAELLVKLSVVTIFMMLCLKHYRYSIVFLDFLLIVDYKVRASQLIQKNCTQNCPFKKRIITKKNKSTSVEPYLII